jgi:hypothetical protein
MGRKNTKKIKILLERHAVKRPLVIPKSRRITKEFL